MMRHDGLMGHEAEVSSDLPYIQRTEKRRRAQSVA